MRPDARMLRVAGALLRIQPDERLAALAGEGSRPAFEELVRRHRAKLVAFAAGIAPPSAADDVVQDAVLKAYLALTRGDRPELPKAWLFTIVRNTALNHLRGWRPHEPLDETIDGVEQPPEAADRKRRLGALVLALEELPSAQRDAIVQRELEGRGHDEIATAMGVSSGAVRQLIHRARASLRASAAALMPMGLLRLIALPGAVEPASSGVGVTAAKLGVGAAIATGALVSGGNVAERIRSETPPDAIAAEAAPAPVRSVSASSAAQAGRDREDGAADERTTADREEDRAEAPPPRPHDRAHHHHHHGSGPGYGHRLGPGGGGGTGGGHHPGGDQAGEAAGASGAEGGDDQQQPPPGGGDPGAPPPAP